MIVRVFNKDGKVMVMYPGSQEALDRDTKINGWDNLQYFDCDRSEIPIKQSSDGLCLRCHWKFNDVDKKVVIKKTFDCEHDILMKIKEKIDSPDVQLALQGLLELEKFKNRKGK